MGPQLALRSLQGSGAAEGKHRWDFLTWICRICASCTEKHRSRMMKQDQRKRNLNHFRQYLRLAFLISPEARTQMRLFKCNPRDFPRASLAKFLDWLWVFVCVDKREQERKVYRFPASVRWSHRSSSWSGGAGATWKFCEILQSPPPCEDLLHG